MGTLVKFELKKLFHRKMNIIVIIFCLFLIATLFFMTGKDFLATDENGVTYKGQEAVRVRKEQVRKISGTLTNERIIKEIQNLQNLRSNPDNLITDGNGEVDFNHKIYNEYLGHRLNLLTNINCVYSKYNAGYITELFNLNLQEQKDFYTNVEEGIEEKLNQNYNGKSYTNQEKEYWLKKAKEVKTPFEYNFYYGWSNLYSTYEMLIIGIIAICICLAPVFAGEYQNGTDKILLTTKYGKSKGITAKVIASYLFATLVFAIYLIFAIGITFLMFGTEGGNLPIQLSNMLSPYALTFLQSLLCNILISYTVLFGMVGLTLFLSSKLKNPMTVLVIDIAIIMLPVFLTVNGPLGIWNKILLLMPYNAIYSNFSQMVSYGIGNIITDLPMMIIISYIFMMIITLIGARKSYQKHQVE